MYTVKDFMTDTVFTLQPDDTLSDVRTLMQLGKIRHTPVVDDDQNFVGLITQRDLLACTISRLADIDEAVQTEIDTAILVRDTMHTDIVCVAPETPLVEAARMLFDHKYGCLPVLNGRRMVGIITEADFLRVAMKLLEKQEKPA